MEEGAMRRFVPAPVKTAVAIDALDALDVRVGTITAIHDIPRSSKLVRLTVDLGDHTRQIVVGMKQERADPGDVVGRQALFVVNLQPREIMGQRSEGMLFDIGYTDGQAPVLAVPERPVPNGVRVG